MFDIESQKDIESALSDPNRYALLIRKYGTFCFPYRNLYYSILSMDFKEIDFEGNSLPQSDAKFIIDQISEFHQLLMLFLKEPLFCGTDYGVQIVDWEKHPYLAQHHQFVDFSEIQQQIDGAIHNNIFYKDALNETLNLEFSAIELLEKQCYKMIGHRVGRLEAEYFIEALMKNLRHCLSFEMFGVFDNFYSPLVKLYKKSYFYLGVGMSNNKTLCHYIGFIRGINKNKQ